MSTANIPTNLLHFLNLRPRLFFPLLSVYSSSTPDYVVSGVGVDLKFLDFVLRMPARAAVT